MSASASHVALPPDLESSYRALVGELGAVFGPRLRAVVAFGPRIRSAVHPRPRSPAAKGDSLALVDRVTIADLTACGTYATRWAASGLRIPLIMGIDEFRRSLDAFPLEFDDIIAHHVPVMGSDPFEGVAVLLPDLRRACEARAKGHLLHLREGYLEAGGLPGGVANLILASTSPFSALVGNLARLQGLPDGTAAQRAAAVASADGQSEAVALRILQLEIDPLLGGDEAGTLYPRYLAAVEHIVAWVDTWPRG